MGFDVRSVGAREVRINQKGAVSDVNLCNAVSLYRTIHPPTIIMSTYVFSKVFLILVVHARWNEPRWPDSESCLRLAEFSG